MNVVDWLSEARIVINNGIIRESCPELYLPVLDLFRLPIERKMSTSANQTINGINDAINKGWAKSTNADILAWLNSDELDLLGTLEKVS